MCTPGVRAEGGDSLLHPGGHIIRGFRGYWKKVQRLVSGRQDRKILTQMVYTTPLHATA